MTGDILPFPSAAYFGLLALLLFARGMDFLSTWVATPNLVLEGNPLARKMGWKWGAVVNLALCLIFAFWPPTAVIVITAGLLVAARNFHSAWLMRGMGEEAYRDWFVERMTQTRLAFYPGLPAGGDGLDGAARRGAGLVERGGERRVWHRLRHPGLCRDSFVLHVTFLVALAAAAG